MYTIDTETRDAFITGLFALAVYLEAHPEVPVPRHGTDILVGVRHIEDGGTTDIQSAAAALDAPVDTDPGRNGRGGWETRRTFGPVDYKIFSLTKASMARHRAEASYWGCVTPDAEIPDA
jgi:hypothetical protein